MSDDELLRQLVDEAWKKALPMIRQRLGSEPERERLDLELVDNLIDGLTEDDDPIEAMKLRELRVALVDQSEGTLPRKSLTAAFDARGIEVYYDLLRDSPVQKHAVFTLAYDLLGVEIGARRALVVCGLREAAIDEVFARAVSRLTTTPLRIDAAKDLVGRNADALLDLHPGAKFDIPRLRREGGRALLLRDLPKEGRPVWVIDQLEDLGSEIGDVDARAHVRTNILRLIDHWADTGTDVARCYEFDREAGFFRDHDVALKGAAFLLRTSQTAHDFWAETNAHKLYKLSLSNVELKRAAAS